MPSLKLKTVTNPHYDKDCQKSEQGNGHGCNQAGKLIVVRVEVHIPVIGVSGDMEEKGQCDKKSDLPGDHNMHLPVDQCRNKG